MKDAISKVKAAVAPKDIASHLSHYLIADGFIHASDNRITAAAPFPLAHGKPFLVPGGDFEAVAERFGSGTAIAVGEANVEFKDGKLKATLKTLPTNMVDYRPPEGKLRAVPTAFLDALRLVRPFISDNAVHYWALSVCLEDEAVYATNNVCVVKALCPGLKGGGRLLPSWAVDYLLSRAEELKGFTLTDQFMFFKWEDGSWMKANLIDGKFPAQAETLLDKMPEPSFVLTEEWRHAYEIISGMTEGMIEFSNGKILGITSHGQVEVDMETSGELSRWQKKFLDPVVAAADKWEPGLWPKPAPFSGPGIKGLIVGRQ